MRPQVHRFGARVIKSLPHKTDPEIFFKEKFTVILTLQKQQVLAQPWISTSWAATSLGAEPGTNKGFKI